MTQQQVNQAYINEIITALEEQRNAALKEAAEVKANFALVSKHLGAILKVIKEKKLEKHFGEEDKAKIVEKPKQKDPPKKDPRKEAKKGPPPGDPT